MSRVLGTKQTSQVTHPVNNSTMLSSQTAPASINPVSPDPATPAVALPGQQGLTGGMATTAVQPVASPASLSTNLVEASLDVVVSLVPTEMGSQMANPKEKTPMCLLNELARFNRLQPKYELTDQTGPPHLKVFSVQLCLGDKKYEATGSSIKKAQHEAAKLALRESTLPKPLPRPPTTRPHKFNPNPDALTATVLLNGYSMKKGIPINYTTVQSSSIDGGVEQHQYSPYSPHQQVYYSNYRHPHPRGVYRHPPRSFSVILNVASQEYTGEGRTMKEAKQNAASKALRDLKEAGEDISTLTKDQATSTASSDIHTETNTASVDLDEAGKSEISLVYELAHPHNLNVYFEVLEESGPAHMKKFKMKCLCGDFVCEGEGLSKKQAKHIAANAMLKKLQTLPRISVPYRPRPRFQKKNKKTKSISKSASTSPELNAALNPISRLVQILQKQEKKVEALFAVIQEKKLPVRRREFTMQCVAGPHKCTGVGPTKKAAKKAAAEEMLRLMGYESEAMTSVRPVLKKSSGEPGIKDEKSDRKVTFAADSKAGRSLGLVPGLLPMLPGMNTPGFAGINRVPPVASNNKQSQVTAAISRELLTNGHSETAAEIIKSGKASTPGLDEDAKLVRPKNQLEYLGQLQGLGVHFQDFPKGNKSEFMSLVSVTTSPKLVAHGSGPTTEASHDAASMTALKLLSEMDKQPDLA